MSTPPPEQPMSETAAAAAEPPAAPPPPPPAPPPPVPPAAAPAPFAPVPREPWVNPARRGQVVGLGLVAALAFLGAGIGIGFAVSGGDHRDRPHNVVVVPRFGYHPGMMGPHGNYGVWPMPRGPYDNGGSATETPSPAPSSTG
jgi:hypothetical protein